jgi:hypothetical protein
MVVIMKKDKGREKQGGAGVSVLDGLGPTLNALLRMEHLLFVARLTGVEN